MCQKPPVAAAPLVPVQVKTRHALPLAFPSSRGATNAGASVSLTFTAIQGEACVATCTNNIAIGRARSPNSRGATSADVQVLA